MYKSVTQIDGNEKYLMEIFIKISLTLISLQKCNEICQQQDACNVEGIFHNI